jgi:hypothetical protein
MAALVPTAGEHSESIMRMRSHRAAPPARVERPAPRVERAVRGGGGGYGGEAQREGQAAAVDFCPWGAEILIGNDILRTAGGELPGIRAL